MQQPMGRQDVYDGKVNIADVKEFQELGQIFEAIKENQKNPLEVSYDDNCGDFATGKTEMIHQGNWCYSLFSSYDVDFDMGIAPLPIEGNKSIAVGVPSVWCVNTDASDSDKQLAKDFLNWLYTSETGADYLTNKFGFIPVVDGMEADNRQYLMQSQKATSFLGHSMRSGLQVSSQLTWYRTQRNTSPRI